MGLLIDEDIYADRRDLLNILINKWINRREGFGTHLRKAWRLPQAWKWGGKKQELSASAQCSLAEDKVGRCNWMG